jgi:phosphoenolpyruvate carboxykinase (GTP)
MAMLPFCGYNMGDYFRHWINTGRLLARPPKIFTMNAFRLNEKGEFLWPGFGENIRILRWVIDRVNGRAGAKETPLGLIPDLKDFPLEGLDIPRENMQKLFEINTSEWQPELQGIKKFLSQFGQHIPYEIWQGFNTLTDKVNNLSLAAP